MLEGTKNLGTVRHSATGARINETALVHGGSAYAGYQSSLLRFDRWFSQIGQEASPSSTVRSRASGAASSGIFFVYSGTPNNGSSISNTLSRFNEHGGIVANDIVLSGAPVSLQGAAARNGPDIYVYSGYMNTSTYSNHLIKIKTNGTYVSPHVSIGTVRIDSTGLCVGDGSNSIFHSGYSWASTIGTCIFNSQSALVTSEFVVGTKRNGAASASCGEVGIVYAGRSDSADCLVGRFSVTGQLIGVEIKAGSVPASANGFIVGAGFDS